MTAPQEPTEPTPETAQPGADLQTELNALRAELESVQTARKSQQDQVLRAMAEAENLRRRAQEDVSKAR
jgi:molecular chaperone GrpE